MSVTHNHPLLIVTGFTLLSSLSACGGGSSSNPASTAGVTPVVSAPVVPAAVPAPVPVVVEPPPPPARYLKLDAGGNELPANATNWSCVKDKDTGLIWEAKSDDGGLRDRDWRYLTRITTGVTPLRLTITAIPCVPIWGLLPVTLIAMSMP